MMRTVQLAIANAVYAGALRDALSRSGPWHVETVERPDPAGRCILVLDEAAFHQLVLPLSHPERVVLISRQDPQLLAQAWDAGIVSVASVEDALPTVLLAIMAASLRMAKSYEPPAASGVSRSGETVPAPIAPPEPGSHPRRCRTP